MQPSIFSSILVSNRCIVTYTPVSGELIHSKDLIKRKPLIALFNAITKDTRVPEFQGHGKANLG